MIDLFTPYGSNLLPYDGEAYYYGRFLDDPDYYLKVLLDTVPWKNDEIRIMGTIKQARRMVAWYGDSAFSYTYSGVERIAYPWSEDLIRLKRIVEGKLEETFNACLLNFYHDGSEGMGWHSDNEDSLVAGSTIASVSLGAERKFSLKHKRTKETVSVKLEHGSLLVMKGETQANWLHSLPVSTVIHQSRVNLTFRKMKAVMEGGQ
jgi:alkylated DNA repair dioxygenase AlkB